MWLLASFEPHPPQPSVSVYLSIPYRAEKLVLSENLDIIQELTHQENKFIIDASPVYKL